MSKEKLNQLTNIYKQETNAYNKNKIIENMYIQLFEDNYFSNERFKNPW